MNIKDKHIIRMTNKMKTKLKELGVYDLWVLETRFVFDDNRIVNNTLASDLLKGYVCYIQKAIYENDVKLLISLVDWKHSYMGFDYWSRLYYSL